MDIKKILVPVDYSDCSINALNYAANLAEQFDSKLMLLHALDSWKLNEQLTKKLKAGHHQNLSAEIANISSVANKMTDIVISEKSPQTAILEAVDTYDVNLIVMGTLGADDLFDKVLGSLTYNIIVNSQCPVLAVPNTYTFFPYQKIGLTVDYKEVLQPVQLETLKDFAFTFNAKIEVFHVTKANEPLQVLAQYEESKLDLYFSDIDHVFMETSSTDVDRAIDYYVDTNEPDLLVMLPHKYSFMQRFTHSSASRRAVHSIKVPILALGLGL